MRLEIIESRLHRIAEILSDGFDRRERFAVQIMAALIQSTDSNDLNNLPEMSVAMADALIDELDKNVPS